MTRFHFPNGVIRKDFSIVSLSKVYINKIKFRRFRKVVLLVIMVFLTQASLGCNESNDQNQKETITKATYRGNSRHTGTYDVNEINFPASEKWKYFNSSKGIYSSPAVANGFVYFGSHDRFLYALDAESGQVGWRFETASSILSAPLVSDGTVFFGSMDGLFYALDAETGAKKWAYKTASSPNPPIDPRFPDHGISSSAVISDGIVYFGTFGGYLYALNSITGEKLWEFKTDSEIKQSPAVSNGVIFYSSLPNLYALDSKTGQSKWTNEIQNGLGATPVIANGLVLYDDGVRLLAYSSDTGKQLWDMEVDLEGGLDSGPSVKDGVAFLGDRNGFYALDVMTGQKKWENTSIQPASTGIPPSIAGNSVYFIDLQANIDVLDVQSGELKGRHKFQDDFEQYWMTPTTMALANGVIYVGSMDGNLYAIEGKS